MKRPGVEPPAVETEYPMSPATASDAMTAEDFFAWVHRPEHRDRWFELQRGEVIEMPPPAKIHGRVCANVAFELEGYVRRRRKGYVTTNDTGVILERDPDTVRGPDVAVYEDASQFADLHPKFWATPPLLAVEVISPDDRARHLIRKIIDYLRNGVYLVWTIDPEDRSATVYRLFSGPVRVDSTGELTGDELLPGLVCRVANLFLMPEEAG
jgi:Uma2 family endonuclease